MASRNGSRQAALVRAGGQPGQRAQLVQDRRPVLARTPLIAALHLLGDHPATGRIQPIREATQPGIFR